MKINKWEEDNPSEAEVTFNKKEQEMISKDYNKISIGDKLPRYKLRKSGKR